jgi:outer membrane protein assembly factor BamD
VLCFDGNSSDTTPGGTFHVRSRTRSGRRVFFNILPSCARRVKDATVPLTGTGGTNTFSAFMLRRPETDPHFCNRFGRSIAVVIAGIGMAAAMLDPLVAQISEPATGVESAPQDTVAQENDAYATARAFDEQGQTSEAINAYRRAIKRYPLAKPAGEAQYRVAELLESTGNTSRAFNAYQALLTNYPDTQNFERAVSAQVNIANRFLEGKPQSILGLSLGSTAPRAQEMYRAILASAPFSKYAPVAQFNLGLASEKDSKPFEAIAAYQAVMDTYPNSDVVDDAMYQIGYVYMRIGFAQQSQDLSSIISAKNTFEDFLIEFSESEKAPQARENLVRIANKESGDIFQIAKFYEFTRDYRAAVIYYNDVIRRQPDTEDAKISKMRIEELRGEVGDEALRTGPERAETGEKLAIRRRLQAQIETSALADFAGPPTRDIVPDELPADIRPRMRTSVDDIRPLPAVEPDLPIE